MGPVDTVMSSTIAAVLKATVCLLVNKGRKLAADKLKDGDVTDQRLRNLIVREIDGTKSQLNGLTRANLLSSISFLKEGIVYLCKVLDKDGKVTEEGAEGVENLSIQQGLRFISAANVKSVSLAEGIRCFHLTDDDDLAKRALSDAKDRFKQAREKATEAFCNEALTTSDRILAMQFRVMATLLEKVDNLTEALAVCRLCLEELHSMPAVQKSFYVQLKQSFMSQFNKTEREDTIRSVCEINRVIFCVMQMAGEHADLSLWPCVECGDIKVDPLRDSRVTESLPKPDTTESVWEAEHVVEDTTMSDCYITTNSKRQFLIAESESHCLKVFERNGKHLHSFDLPLLVKKKDGGWWWIKDIATDRDNNVLLLVNWSSLKGHRSWSTVNVCDERANEHDEFQLKDGFCGSFIAASDNDKVFVAVERFHVQEVQIYDRKGVFLKSFGKGTLANTLDMTVTHTAGGKVMVLESLSNYEFCFHLFSEQGDHLFRFTFQQSSPCHRIGAIASHHASERVFVFLSGDHDNRHYPRMLYIFKKDGELVRNIHLHTESLLNCYTNPLGITVTDEGIVTMCTIDKTTSKQVIVVL